MANVVVYDKNEAEKALLIRILRDAAAFYSNDKLLISDYPAKKIEKIADMALMEIAEKSDVSICEEFRIKQFAAEVLLVAEGKISPMEYLRPSIRAVSLIIRPVKKENAIPIIREFIAGYYRGQAVSDTDSIVIENRHGKSIIPTIKVYYLEVREKRVYIRLADKEYVQYDTLENMLKKLPSYFIRCHRSFAFNRTYLQNVRLSENTIYLEHGIMVPLSRSYKAEIKELLDEYR